MNKLHLFIQINSQIIEFLVIYKKLHMNMYLYQVVL